jgi:CRP-like cAMP-binding protein
MASRPAYDRPQSSESKVAARDLLSDAKRRVIEMAPVREASFQSRQELARQGDDPSESCLVLEGLTARFNDLSDGRRQITAIHIPGDFVDLHSLLLGRMDHGVVALTDCQVAYVPHASLRKITDEHPGLTRALWRDTLVDAAVHRQWLVASGRRSASEHLAHLICEMFLRFQLIGKTHQSSFEFRITQEVLADAVGMSVVHVNRTIQELRGSGLITWQGPKVTINDWEGLTRHAEFDPTYLHLEPAA